jgi:UDP-GlcNAc:undecaprenyl-phosphate GlcNAc-1-phosphate transferase
MIALLEKYSMFFILPILTLALSLIFTRLLIPVLLRFNMIEVCGGRHIHEKKIPTSGGLAIIVSFSTVMLLSYFSPLNEQLGAALMKIDFFKLLIPLLVLIPCGIIDDSSRTTIRVRYKFLLHILTAALAWYFGARVNSIFGYEIPVILSFFLTVFWIVSFINAFNFIDGLDGLAAGTSAISAIFLSIVFFMDANLLYAFVMLCFASSCLGFLRYNFYPSKIFMGDTGSMFLGYMFATVALLSSSQRLSFSAIVIVVIACGIPLLDIFLAIWRRGSFRLLDKEDPHRFTSTDNEHLHHRIFAKNKSQSKTSILFYWITFCLGVISIFVAALKDTIPGISLILLMLTFLIIIKKFAVIEIQNSKKLICRIFKKQND